MSPTPKRTGAVLSIAVLLLTARTIAVQAADEKPPSDTLTLSRLDADRNDQPSAQKEVGKITLKEPPGNQDVGELDVLIVPKTIYEFAETGTDKPEVSDRLIFESFNVWLFSGKIPPADAKELPNIPLTSIVEEQADGVTANIDLVKFSMTSGFARETGTEESDSLTISSTTTDNKGKPYSYSNTLTGTEEATLKLGGTIPKQAIKFTEFGASSDVFSDVVVIDPIKFSFVSDTEDTTLTASANAITFKMNFERVKDATAFFLTVHSDGDKPVPEGGGAGTSVIALIALGGMLLKGSKRPGSRQAWTA